MIKKYWAYILPLILLISLHLFFILRNSSLMIFYGDSFEEMLMMYLGGWERFHSLNFSLWDWTLGFGANYFSRTYYFLGSPFFYLSLLFPKSWIPEYFLYANLFKLYLVWIFTYVWIREVTNNNYTGWISGMMLTFSGWTMMFYHYNFFLDAFLFYPLILFFVERYINKKQWIGLVVSIAVLSITNFYFVYMFIPFLGLYYWMRILSIKPYTIKNFSIETIRFVGYIVLGLGLSAFMLLPNIQIIIDAPRLSGFENLNLFDPLSVREIYRYFSSLYTPVMERFDPSYFISTSIDPGVGWGGGVSLYVGYLPLLILPLVFMTPNKRVKYSFLLILTFVLILASSKGFYRLLQGTVDVRWYYMFSLLFIYGFAQVFNMFKLIKNYKNLLLVSMFMNVLVISSLYLFSVHQAYVIDTKQIESLRFVVAYASILIIIYTFLLSSKKLNKFALALIVGFEMSVSFYLPLTLDPPIQDIVIEKYLETLLDDSAVRYIESIDDGFYRILQDDQIYLNQNEPFVQNYKGMSFYTSVYNFNQDAYYDRFNETYSIPSTFGRDYSYLLTSVKYFISSSNNHQAPLGFEFLIKVDGFNIYQNKYFIELGWLQSKSLNQSTFDKLSYLDQDRLLLDYAVSTSSMNTEYEFRNQLTLFADDVYVDRYYFYNPFGFQNSMVIIQNNDINGVTLKSSLDSEFLYEEKFGQNFYITKTYDVKFVNGLEILTPGSPSSMNGYDIYLDTDLSWVDDWYFEKSKLSLNEVETNHSSISASIYVEEEQSMLITSIPYDEGWHLKVDGKSQETLSINDGFIGVNLSKGNHELYFYYRSPWFYEGILISVICIMIIFNLVEKNKNGY